MKVVVDTNVLVSGLLNPFGAPAEIVRMISAGSLIVCYDARILLEYQDVLSRPVFQFKENHVGALLDQVQYSGEIASSGPLKKHLPDPDDEMFLEAAIFSKVRYLITGNLKHYPSALRQNVPVVSPRQFLECYRESSGSIS